MDAAFYQRFDTQLAELRELYRKHIHTEDTEIFQLAGSLLSASELKEVGDEMRARRGLPG